VTLFIPDPQLLASPRHRPWPARAAATTSPPAASLPDRADVVIVGAGPAGLATATALWHRGVRGVVLLDRSGPPCRRFFDRIDLLDQRVLRSPYEHHPGAEGYRDCELLDFARLHWSLLTAVERREIRMAQAGHRSVVPVDVFEAYCRHVAATHQVDARTWRADVRELAPGADAVLVRPGDAELTARYVVLCQGEERRQAPAAWRVGEGCGYWDEPVPDGPERIVVVGAGLTAAHLIAGALRDGRRVAWVFREKAERYQCSDVDAAFFRAEGRARFDGVRWDERLKAMGLHRRASVMFEFRPLLRQAEATGQLAVHRGRTVIGVTSRPAGVRLADGGVLTGDHVVLALGTTPSAGERLLPGNLAGARDGWPDLDPATFAYRRAPRVFAVGATAGMIIGPAARNIDGHRVATARVAMAIAAGLDRAAPRAPRLAAPLAPRPARPSPPDPLTSLTPPDPLTPLDQLTPLTAYA
jgi:Pyridine nucleotide-disulphide oxidoreductase